MSKYKNTTIYFMSGTGNSYRVATWAGDESKKQGMNCQIIPFEKAEPEKELITNKETLLGIFLPTHGFTAPWVMIKFVMKLPAGEGTHAFVSASRGGTKFGKISLPGFEGTAAYLLALILKIKGYKMRGVIGMDMPLNWTALIPGFSKETAVNMGEKQKPKFAAFFKSILDGKKNFGFWTFFCLFLGILISPFSLGYLFIARYFLAKMFFATSECNNCGLCANYCPANAIQMRGDDNPIPFWTTKCESCMRCMNFCPKQAIESSHLLAVGFYYLASIPVGLFLMKRLVDWLPFLQQINSGIFKTLLQYGYMMFAFVMAYYVFYYLIKIKFINKVFTYATLTHYYRRYRQPDVKLKDFNKKNE